MNEYNWLDKEEWDICEKHMDVDTFEEFKMFVKADEPFSVGIPEPIIKIVDVCEDFHKYRHIYKDDYQQKYNNTDSNDSYKELYKFLAFTLYGYGNWKEINHSLNNAS